MILPYLSTTDSTVTTNNRIPEFQDLGFELFMFLYLLEILFQRRLPLKQCLRTTSANIRSK